MQSKWKCKNCEHIFSTESARVIVRRVELLEFQLFYYNQGGFECLEEYFKLPRVFCPNCRKEALYPCVDRKYSSYEMLEIIEEILRYSEFFEEVK